MLLRPLGAAALGLVLCACPSDPKACAAVGSGASPIQAAGAGLLLDGGFGLIPDGGAIAITEAPQGGFILYAGAYATNLDPCVVTLSAELLAPDGGAAISNSDQRQSDFKETQGPLFGPADFRSAMPNVPICDGVSQGIASGPAILQVTVTDAQGKSAVLRQTVFPTCAACDQFCASVCGGPADAGCSQ